MPPDEFAGQRDRDVDNLNPQAEHNEVQDENEDGK